MDIMELREYLRPNTPINGYDGTGSFIEKSDLYDIGTMGISTLKYAKYGIWGTYLGTQNMVKRSVTEKILQNAVQTN